MALHSWGRRALLLLLCSPSLALAQPLDFDRAWQQVLSQNPGLKAEQGGITKAEQLADAARALYLPDISISGQATHLAKPVELDLADLNPMPQLAQDPTLGPLLGQLLAGIGGSSALVTPFTKQDLVTSSVQAMWPLYAGGRIDAAQTIRAAQVDEARQQYALKQMAAFETLAQRYFGVQLAQQLRATRQAQQDLLSHHLTQANQLAKQGQIAEVERLSAESALANAQIQTDQARRQLEIAQLALASLLGETGQPQPSLPLFINRQLPAEATLLSDTLAHHPGLQLLDAKARQAEGLASVESGKRLPEVFLYGNYQLYEQDTLAAKMAPDWLVGVGVKVPLVSREGHSDTLAAAATTRLQVRDLLAQLRQDLSLLVQQSWREADQARQEYESSAHTLTLAQANLKLRQSAFTQGLGTSLDVQEAQTRLLGVQTQRQAAAYRYDIALARLLALAGRAAEFSQYPQHADVEFQS